MPAISWEIRVTYISQVASFDEKDAELVSCMLSSGVNCGRTMAALTELTGSGSHAKMALMLGEASALIKTSSSLAAASEAASCGLPPEGSTTCRCSAFCSRAPRFPEIRVLKIDIDSYDCALLTAAVIFFI